MLRNPGLRKSVEQPVLDLNFAASQIGSNAAPDSRIDFSRGSNAWFVDTDGLVKKSPHNLQVYSQDFDNAAWAKTRVTVSANATTAPDGTLTADKILETTDNGGHYWRDFASAVAGERFFFSVFAKAAERKYLHLWTGFGSGGHWPQVWNLFDVEAGTVITSDPDADSVTIEDVGNGWFRCTTSITADSTGLDDIGFGLWDGVGSTPSTINSYAGDASKGLFLWGAQFSQHTTLPVDNPYVKTDSSAVYAARLDHDPTWFMSAAQEQNLLQYSEMLDDSGWTKNSVTVTANAETDPLGGTTAEYIFATSPSGAFPSIQGSFDTKKGAVHTVSFYAKAGEIDVVSVGIRTSSGGFVSDPFSNQALTSEWQRFSGTFTATEDTHLVRFFFGSGAKTWSGDQGFYIWGTQVEVGSTASTYHRTEGQPYYGEGATPKGLLIEEARTNLVPHSEEFNDSYFTTARASVTANAALAPDGTTTADELVENTDNNSHLIRFDDAVVSGTTYTMSVFAKAASGDRRLKMVFNTHNSGFAFSQAVFRLDNGTVSNTSCDNATIEDFGNGWFRCTATETATATTSAARFILHINDTSGSTYTGDGSSGLYFWGLQVEAGAFPTSYIKTTGASATRNADVATMGPVVAPLKTTGPEIIVNGTFDTDSNWIDDDQGTGSSSISNGKLVLSGDDFANRSMRYQQVTLVDGERYRLSFDKFDDQMVVRVGTSLQGDELVSATFSSTASGGESFNYDFTANGTTAYVRFIHQNTGSSPSGTSRIDNVSLKKIQAGTELVVNGTFDTNSDWNLPSGGQATIAGGVLDYSSAPQFKSTIQQLESRLVIGRRYRASIDIVSITSGAIDLRYFEDGVQIANTGNKTTAGTYTIDFTCSDLTSCRFNIQSRTTDLTTAQLDNASVRELYPWEQYNFAEGTIFMEGSVPFTPQANNFTALVRLEGADPNTDRIDLRLNSLPQLSALCKVGGANTMSLGVHNVDANEVFRFGVAFKEDSFAVASSQKLATSIDNSGAIVTVEKMSLAPIDTYINAGHFKRILYFARRIPDKHLQSMVDPFQL